jgi:hypothetical protein
MNLEPPQDLSFNTLQPANNTAVNRSAAFRAQQQIRQGHFDKESSFAAPSTAAQDAYLTKEPEMFGSWFLGYTNVNALDFKERFEYPFSSDFKTVSRQALVEARALAIQRGDVDIAQAADQLIQIIDGNTLPLNSSFAGLSMTVHTAEGAKKYVTTGMDSFQGDLPSSEESDVASSDKPYGDVHYCDNGMQSDGKKRFPCDTEEHIRAAWSYSHHQNVTSKYTPEQLAKLHSCIESAWKAKIDPAGPPSA